MMNNWDYSQGNMMGSMGIWAFLLWLVIFVDLVLLGVWLWKLIQKN